MEIQTDLLPYLVNCFYTYFYLYFNNKEQISSMTSDHKSFIISTVGPVLVVVDIRLPYQVFFKECFLIMKEKLTNYSKMKCHAT